MSANHSESSAKGHAGHSHSHSGGAHSHRSDSKTKMLAVLVLIAVYMIVELAVGLMTGSLALLADAGHMLSDVGALALSLIALWFSSRPATRDMTYGYYRSEILAGFINGLLLICISVFILFESYQRFAHPPEIAAMPVLIVAVFGLVVNLVSVRLLHANAKESINVRAAYLEIVADLMATVGVIVSSILILLFKWYVADPAISSVIALMILPRTWMLLTECTNILMEGTPGHVNLENLRDAIMSVKGVVDAHDIHVWTLTSNVHAMSAHVTIDGESRADDVLIDVTRIVAADFQINHSTIQVEQLECKTGGISSCGP